MGVQGLWELLAPVGRRVSVESLGSRRLAIDASIWIIQFMKAMRDDRGDMIRNAHLLGFFRRICKLLFLRIKPVFVFDGGTPALKRRTVIARRRQREQAQFKIRKTAEKLLLNHLRTRKLEEIAGGFGAPLVPPNATFSKGKKAQCDNDTVRDDVPSDNCRSDPQSSPPVDTGVSCGGMHNQECADALLAASLAGQQLDENTEGQTHVAQGLDQEKGVKQLVEDDDDDDDDEEEELVYLPTAQGKLDPAVLASLPPSMQLDLLVQMREQLVAENRQKFEKVAKAPATFSQLQIEAYLKTVAFRREINNVQKAAAGRGVGGVPSTRIASATNREFIFSSSYQGDKMALTGANGGNPMSTVIKPPQPVAQPPEVPASSVLSALYRDGTKSLGSEEADKKDSSVQTYVDEKGRTRVSRVRGMGVRMTRDLQWNLYLMKDVEKQQAFADVNEDDEIATAEKLVSNGDGEAFQRLMLGDKSNLYTSLSVDSLKQQGESDQMMNSSSLNSITSRGLEIASDQSALQKADIDDGEMFNRLVGGDVRSSCKDSSVNGHAECVSGDVRLNKSILQISLDIEDDGQDEDMDLFKTLVRGEENSCEIFQGPQRFPACTVGPEGIVNKEEDEDDCEWEDGDTQGRQPDGTMSKEQMIAVKSSEEISEACHNEHAKNSVGIQENLHKLAVDRKVPHSREYKIPIPDDDDDDDDDVMDAAAQMTLAIEKSLEANISEPQPHPGSQFKGYSSARLSDKVSTTAFEANLVDNVQNNKNGMYQSYNSAKFPNNFSSVKSNEEQIAMPTQHSLQVYSNNVGVTESQPYIHNPTSKNFSLAGDSDAEMALAIQQSLAEHDRTRALQLGAYPESEDTGLSDDSDTGNSDESEVEWEDGSGAVAVAGAGFAAADPGLFLTEEDAELQEAIRRSLDDVGSWRAPVRPLPQLVIREPMEDVRERSGSLEIPAIGTITGEDRQPLNAVEKTMDVDSEEARLARERARKGKAVAGENVISPVPVRKPVLQPGLELEDPYQEYLKGKGMCENDGTPGGRGIGNEHLGPAQMGTELVSSLISEGLVPPQQEQAEGKENRPPSSLGVEDAGTLHRDTRRSSQEISNSNARIHSSLTHSTRNFEEAGTIAERPAVPSEVWRQDQVDQAIHTSVERSTTHSNVPFKEANPMLLSGMVPRIEDNDSTSKKTGVLETQSGSDGSRDVQLRGHNPHENVQGLNAVPEHVASDPQDLRVAEDILKDAEEMDLAQERSEMLNYEAKLLVEREALAREEAELQAALQEEQEELRTGIEKERELLFQEEIELREAQNKNERNADSVTGEMFAECQELLQMFGLPYIIAPMEAEAQCAYMNTAELVDGVVTDDCDVFLFGGRNVYKNIFDDRKYVETYYMKDVETEMGMSREKLIRMALLLGSDYTEGISGIGIVNAIEVVNAFDEADGLSIFKKMVESPDYSLPGLQGLGYEMKGRRGKQTNKGKSGMEKMVENDNDGAGIDVGPENDIGDADIKLRRQVFMEKHRAVSKNWMIPDSFPSDAVVAAYANPQVDTSTDPFTWGRPDLEALRKFCYERFAWPKSKADDLLLPVLKEYDRRETQLRIDAFYSFNQRFAKVRSARIQKALRGTTGHQLSDELLDVPSQEGRPPAKKPKKTNKEATSAGTKCSELLVEDGGNPKVVKGRGRGTSHGRRGQQTGQRGNVGPVSVDGQSVQEEILDESQGLEGDGPSQGHGRGKLERNGRGTGRGRGRGRSSTGTIQDKDESSSSGSASEGAAHGVLESAGASKRKAVNQLVSLRRSSRARTQANYNEPEGSDDAEHDGSSDGGSSSGQSQDDMLERNGSKKSSQVPLDPVITKTWMDQRTPLLIAKTEVLDSIPDVRVGVQPRSTEIYTSGGGFGVCNSDGELDATGRSFESPSIFHDSTSARGDEIDAAAEMQQRLEPPEYVFTGGGFCVSDEEDVSPSLEHSQERDNDNGECKGVGALEESHLNLESNDHVDSVQHVGDPLVTPALSVDKTILRVEMETQSTSAEPVQVPNPVGDIMKAEQNVVRVDTGLRAMPMLRRKRPPKVP